MPTEFQNVFVVKLGIPLENHLKEPFFSKNPHPYNYNSIEIISKGSK
jgi:hypothetical protein